MSRTIERILDVILENPARIAAIGLVAFSLLLVTVMSCVWPSKPTYQDMAEMTIVVQTGRTECHYVPAWKTVSCVTMPPVYGPMAPAAVP